MERWRDREIERWRDGEMERWRDGEMKRWRDGEMEWDLGFGTCLEIWDLRLGIT